MKKKTFTVQNSVPIFTILRGRLGKDPRLCSERRDWSPLKIWVNIAGKRKILEFLGGGWRQPTTIPICYVFRVVFFPVSVKVVFWHMQSRKLAYSKGNWGIHFPVHIYTCASSDGVRNSKIIAAIWAIASTLHIGSFHEFYHQSKLKYAKPKCQEKGVFSSKLKFTDSILQS